VVYVGLAIALEGMAFFTCTVSTGKLALHNNLFAAFCCPGGCCDRASITREPACSTRPGYSDLRQAQLGMEALYSILSLGSLHTLDHLGFAVLSFSFE
jgi:hypothetical protein